MRETRIKCHGDGGASDRLLIFAFFLAGGMAAFFLPLPSALPVSERALLGGMLAGVLLLSVSLLGEILLPLFALGFGAATERAAMEFASAFDTCGPGQIRSLLCGMVLTPILFLVLLHGLRLSSSIQTTLMGASPSSRIDYRRELGAQLACAMPGFAAIFYFY